MVSTIYPTTSIAFVFVQGEISEKDRQETEFRIDTLAIGWHVHAEGTTLTMSEGDGIIDVNTLKTLKQMNEEFVSNFWQV